eukprot:gene6276-10283_t
MDFKKQTTPEGKFKKSKEISKKFLYSQSEVQMNFSSNELASIRDEISELQSKYNLQKLLKDTEVFVNSEIECVEENNRFQKLKSNSEERMNQILDSMFDSILTTIKQNMNDSFLRFKLDSKFVKCENIISGNSITILVESEEYTNTSGTSKGSSISSMVGKMFSKSFSFKRRSASSLDALLPNEKETDSRLPNFPTKRKSNPLNEGYSFDLFQ